MVADPRAEHVQWPTVVWDYGVADPRAGSRRQAAAGRSKQGTTLAASNEMSVKAMRCLCLLSDGVASVFPAGSVNRSWSRTQWETLPRIILYSYYSLKFIFVRHP